MKRNTDLYEEARRLREEEQLSIDGLAARLSVKRTTVYGWIRDIPLSKGTDRRVYALNASRAMSAKYKQKRKAAYEAAAQKVSEWMQDRQFRDFVVLYLAEGSRRTRYSLAISNTDPDIIRIGYSNLQRFSSKNFYFYLLCHSEVEREKAVRFWADVLKIPKERIEIFGKPMRKSSRTIVASSHGVMTVRVNDCYAREAMQACMDWMKADWAKYG